LGRAEKIVGLGLKTVGKTLDSEVPKFVDRSVGDDADKTRIPPLRAVLAGYRSAFDLKRSFEHERN